MQPFGLIKRILSLLLAFVMLCGIGVCGAYAEAPANLIRGTVKLTAPDGSDRSETPYYYSDDYFRSSGKVSDEHLRTMSAIAAFYIRGKSVEPLKAYGGLLRELGFGHFAAYDLDGFSADSIGMLLAYKTIDGVPVIAVEFRGDAYDNEWASNFLAGLSGDMTGFAQAAQKAEERIQAYLLQMGMKKAKFWIVGYSRAGAVANLVGRELNDHPDLYETTEDDIYVYTFEAPLCTDDPAAYENIHNVIDSNDVVTLAYPAVWPAYRNGVDEEIGDPEATVMAKQFSLLYPYYQDIKEINLSDYLDEFIDLFGTNISREDYAAYAEEYLSMLFDLYFSLSDQEHAVLFDFFGKVAENVRNDPRLMSAAMSLMLGDIDEETLQSITTLLMDNIAQTAEAEGLPVSSMDFKKLTAAIPSLIKVILPVIKADMLLEIPDEQGEPTTVILYHVITFAFNAGDIISHHYNYSILERLMALDPYYAARTEHLLGDVDDDGFVDIIDATSLLRYILKLYDLDEEGMIRADVDRDGDVNVIDATWIQRWAIHLPAPEGIGLPI